MILDKELRDMLTRAFNAGFAISREGFNAECLFVHMAPDDHRLMQTDEFEPEIAEFARTAVDRLMREVL